VFNFTLLVFVMVIMRSSISDKNFENEIEAYKRNEKNKELKSLSARLQDNDGLTEEDRSRCDVLPYLKIAYHLVIESYRSYYPEELYSSKKQNLQDTKYDRRMLLALLWTKFVYQNTKFGKVVSDTVLLQIWFFLKKEWLLQDIVNSNYQEVYGISSDIEVKIQNEIDSLSKHPSNAELLTTRDSELMINDTDLIAKVSQYGKTLKKEKFIDFLWKIMRAKYSQRISPSWFMITQAIKHFIDGTISPLDVYEKIYKDEKQETKSDFIVWKQSKLIAKSFFQKSKLNISAFDMVWYHLGLRGSFEIFEWFYSNFNLKIQKAITFWI